MTVLSFTPLFFAVMPGDTDFTFYETERPEETRKVYTFQMPVVTPLDQNTTVSYSGSGTATGGEPEVNTPPGLSRLMENHIRVNREVEEIAGFRIQIYAGSNKDAATSLRADFSETFHGWKTYMEYLTPNFTLRVGDYLTRQDAMRDLARVKVSFPGAFVVNDDVKMPKLKPSAVPSPGQETPDGSSHQEEDMH